MTRERGKVGASNAVIDMYPSLKAAGPDTFEALSAAAESWLERILARHISPGVYTETFSGENTPFLFLSSPPVKSIINIEIAGYGNEAPKTYPGNGPFFRVTEDGRVYFQATGFWNQRAGWQPGIANIKVTYQSGGLSQPVQDLLVGSVMNWWHQAAEKSVLMASETIMSYSYEMRTDGKGVPPQVMTLLQPYMVRTFV